MSFEKQLMAELDFGKTSKSTFVRKTREFGFNALIARVDAMSERKAIDASVEKDGAPVASHIKQAGRRAALRKHLEKIDAGMKAIADAEADIERNTPPLRDPAMTAADAIVEQEMRAAFRALPDDARHNLKAPPEMLMAVARVPGILSGLPDATHARLVDGVRRQLYPERMAELDNDRRAIKAARTALEAHEETARASLGHAVETSALKVSAA